MNVIEVPCTTASLLGEDKIGAEGGEKGGVDVGVGSPPNPNSEQANPEASNIHKQNTMIILEFFIFYLQLIPRIFNRISYSIYIVRDYFVVVDLSMYVTLKRAVHQLRKPRNISKIHQVSYISR